MTVAGAGGGPLGRGEPVRARRDARGQPGRAEAAEPRSSRSATGSGAASARSRRAATACARSSPRSTPSSASTSAAITAAGVAALHRRARSCGAEEAARVPRLRHAVHARTPARRADGLVAKAPARPTTATDGTRDEPPAACSHAMPAFQLQCPIPISDYPTVHAGARRRRAADADADRADVRAGVRATAAAAARCCRAARRRRSCDSAAERRRLAFSTDSFVVSPLFFPGGDIGSLAVHGTVNDLAMCGARPLALSAGFILEEGLPMDELWRIVQSMAAAARGARACRSSPATPRWSTAARATASSSTPPASGVIPRRGRDCAATAPGPATWS